MKQLKYAEQNRLGSQESLGHPLSERQSLPLPAESLRDHGSSLQTLKFYHGQ